MPIHVILGNKGQCGVVGVKGEGRGNSGKERGVATIPEIEEMEQSGTSTANADNNTKKRYVGSLRNGNDKGNDKETHVFDLSRCKNVVVGSSPLLEFSRSL